MKVYQHIMGGPSDIQTNLIIAHKRGYMLGMPNIGLSLLARTQFDGNVANSSD